MAEDVQIEPGGAGSAKLETQSDFERAIVLKIGRRLLPLLAAAYLVQALDRSNVAIAKLQMDSALGLSETAYGFGAGIFFVGYCLFEVPSNIALHRFGARRWIARIMFTWGIVSASAAFIAPLSAATGIPTRWVFFLQRLLLGVAEAGFTPGAIYYLTLWFPAAYRARAIGLFCVGSMMALILGQPLSGALLNLAAGGLRGWQWLFIIEGSPALALAIVVLLFLTDRPAVATWLSQAERGWLETRLDAERWRQGAVQHLGPLTVLTDLRVLACGLVFFLGLVATFGLSFFLPSIIRAFGVGYFETGLLAALPYLCGALGMLVFTRRSDRTQRRSEHLCFAMLLLALGITGAAMVPSPVAKLGFLCLAQVGGQSIVSLMQPIPSSFLTGASAAVGLAAVSSIGSLGGLVGPSFVGWLRDFTGDYRAGLLAVAASAFFGGLLAMSLKFSNEAGAKAEAALSKATS
jgi:MFS family permease